MPGYINPYMQTFAPYGGNAYAAYPTVQPQPTVVPQQAYAQTPMTSNVIGVDGEVGAKAYMVPNGSTGPIALWDTNDNVIYLRTFNAAGMPNPLRKLRYTEEDISQSIPNNQSGSAAPAPDMSQYVTKQDLEELKQEIQSMNRNNNYNVRGNNNPNNNRNNNQNDQGR